MAKSDKSCLIDWILSEKKQLFSDLRPYRIMSVMFRHCALICLKDKRYKSSNHRMFFSL